MKVLGSNWRKNGFLNDGPRIYICLCGEQSTHLKPGCCTQGKCVHSPQFDCAKQIMVNFPKHVAPQRGSQSSLKVSASAPR